MENDTELLQCYNRGCGQKYDSNKNSDGKQVMFSRIFFSVLNTFYIYSI